MFLPAWMCIARFTYHSSATRQLMCADFSTSRPKIKSATPLPPPRARPHSGARLLRLPFYCPADFNTSRPFKITVVLPPNRLQAVNHQGTGEPGGCRGLYNLAPAVPGGGRGV